MTMRLTERANRVIRLRGELAALLHVIELRADNALDGADWLIVVNQLRDALHTGERILKEYRTG